MRIGIRYNQVITLRPTYIKKEKRKYTLCEEQMNGDNHGRGK